MDITSILANDEDVSVFDCTLAMADIISVTVEKPQPYPESATQNLSEWITWFKSSPAGSKLHAILDDLRVDHIHPGDLLWKEMGYLLPLASPTVGPCQFEFAHLIRAGSDGGCYTLVCSVPSYNGFCITFGTNIDGTRLFIWPQNIGLGKLDTNFPASRNGW